MEAAEEPEQSAPSSTRPEEKQNLSSISPIAPLLESNAKPENAAQVPMQATTRPLYETLQIQNGPMPPTSITPTPAYPFPTIQRPIPEQTYEHFGISEEAFQSHSTPQPSVGNTPAFYPQTTYSIFPGQPYLPAPTSKKRSYVPWIVGIIVLLLLLGGGTTLAFALALQPPPPDTTIQTYCHGVKTSNAQEIYNTLSRQAQAKTSVSDIQQMFGALQGLSGLGISYSECTFSDVRISGSLAVATVTLTLTMRSSGANVSLPDTSLISLILEKNQWKIDFSNLTQPLPGLLSSSV